MIPVIFWQNIKLLLLLMSYLEKEDDKVLVLKEQKRTTCIKAQNGPLPNWPILL